MKSRTIINPNLVETASAVSMALRRARSGRVKGDLLLTAEDYEACPGEDQFDVVNKQGERVRSKRLLLFGAPTVDLRVTTIEEGES